MFSHFLATRIRRVDIPGFILGGHSLNNACHTYDIELIAGSERTQSKKKLVATETTKTRVTINCEKTKCMIVSKGDKTMVQVTYRRDKNQADTVV